MALLPSSKNLNDLVKLAIEVEKTRRPAFAFNTVFTPDADPFRQVQSHLDAEKARLVQHLTSQAMGVVPNTLKGVRMFADKSGGFNFDRHVWKQAVAIHGKEYMAGDATAHRNEALSRKVACRLEGLMQEVDHWHAQMRFLENLCNLKPIQE